MRHSPVRLLGTAWAVAVLTMAGCGEDNPVGPTNTPPDTTTNTPTRSVEADPSFDTVITEIFSRNGCTASGCHGSAANAGLELVTDPYGNLVDIASTQVAALDRVTANDTIDSYLVIKLEGTDARMQGLQMPRNGTPLDTIDMNNIKNWIKSGAANN